MTLDRCYIDFDRGMFAHGQAYVAFSRCRSLEGLELSRALRPRDIIIDRSAFDFGKLETGERHRTLPARRHAEARAGAEGVGRVTAPDTRTPPRHRRASARPHGSTYSPPATGLMTRHCRFTGQEGTRIRAPPADTAADS